MIDPKAAKKLILSGIADRAVADAFTAKAQDQALYRPMAFGRCIIHIGFIPHGTTDIDVTADIAIRVDAVEVLVNDMRNDLSARESAKTATIGGDIGNISEGRQKRWTVASLAEVANATMEIYLGIRAVALPFFERYSDMRNVLGVLSSSNSRDWLLSPGHVARCRRALALAFTLGDAQDIDAVLRASESLLSQKDPSELPQFFTYASNLKAKQANGQLPKLV